MEVGEIVLKILCHSVFCLFLMPSVVCCRLADVSDTDSTNKNWKNYTTLTVAN